MTGDSGSGQGAENGSDVPARDSASKSDLSLTQVELVERISWLIRLRWLAFAGVTATILISRVVFDSDLPWRSLLLTASTIPVYNAGFYLAWRHVNREGTAGIERISALLANAQIMCDLEVLGALIHFSGGAENPFCLYFVFHMVIASTLLSRRAAFGQAGFAVAVFATVVVGEYYGLLPHYTSPIGMEVRGLYESPTAVFAAVWVLATSLFFAVYFATSIVARLRWREDQVMSLSKEVTRHAEELQVAYDRLAEIERAKSAYARKVVHELRSPLAAIENLLRVVAEGLLGELTPKATETIAQARLRIRGLLDVVSDLLAIASAREAIHTSERTEVDLRKALDNILFLLAHQAEDRHITIHVEMPDDLPAAHAHREGIDEVLTNLLGNAIKYSRDGGTVEVRVSRDDSSVEIEVTDSGIGIAEDDHEKIFGEFYRAGNAREFTSDGTGLGLCVVKSVVDAHGGSIQVESCKDKGSKFTVRLPLAVM